MIANYSANYSVWNRIPRNRSNEFGSMEPLEPGNSSTTKNPGRFQGCWG